MAEAELLQLRGIGKRFPGVVALDGVDFTVRAGEIHALLGENGAGKSTLIKVLTGVHPADSGTITLEGRAIRPEAPKDAERAGISTVYQEVNLVPSLSIAENIALGRQPGRFGFINWPRARRHAREALARLEIDCDVDAELGTLSVALQQMVAIARALDVQARVLILDEPTASLDEKEVGELFEVMRRLRQQGLGIVFVTHFLDQVYAVSDRITVLRNGRLVGEYAAADLPRLELVSKMLGRELAAAAASQRGNASATQAPTVLTAKGIGRRGAIQPLDLTLRRGEVTGLAGLLGSGRTETARLLFGIDRPDAGELRVNDRPVRFRSPRDAIRLGLAFSSEDRKTEGILPNLSVRENLIIALQAKRGAARALAAGEQASLCDHYIRALRIKTPNAETPIRNLSGGNQQKVLLARWLATRPELIILDEPTRGIDIGAKQEIEQLVAQLSSEGMAVLFISSELEEVVRRCSRVVVLRERHCAGELTGDDIEIHRLMQTMAGHHDA
ncbi:MAG TPA: sugar ABC transporter ATP-binding protein [Candidatus Synoicihabitans sp.]|nr:sugar ABC transporter ATP-binding protein [Candidatus Synoicihabitans sp.]